MENKLCTVFKLSKCVITFKTLFYFPAIAETFQRLQDGGKEVNRGSLKLPSILLAKIQEDCPRDCYYTR